MTANYIWMQDVQLCFINVATDVTSSVFLMLVSIVAAFVFGLLFGITAVILLILVAVLAVMYCQRRKVKYIYLVNQDP